MEEFINKIVRTKRKTLALVITDAGDLEIRAPLKASLDSIRKFVLKNSSWIENKTQAKKAFVAKYRNFTFPEKFIDGETVLYQGESYKLQISNSENIYISDVFNFPKKFLPQAKQRLIIWLKHQAVQQMVERAEYFSRATSLQYTDIKITSAKGIWGSCNPKGKVAVNWRLVMAPRDIFDYIVVHELVHLEIRNHSKIFWSKVAQIFPDYKKCECWLKQHGAILML